MWASPVPSTVLLACTQTQVHLAQRTSFIFAVCLHLWLTCAHELCSWYGCTSIHGVCLISVAVHGLLPTHSAYLPLTLLSLATLSTPPGEMEDVTVDVTIHKRTRSDKTKGKASNPCPDTKPSSEPATSRAASPDHAGGHTSNHYVPKNTSPERQASAPPKTSPKSPPPTSEPDSQASDPVSEHTNPDPKEDVSPASDPKSSTAANGSKGSPQDHLPAGNKPAKGNTGRTQQGRNKPATNPRKEEAKPAAAVDVSSGPVKPTTAANRKDMTHVSSTEGRGTGLGVGSMAV
jgi:hypothetical protein